MARIGALTKFPELVELVAALHIEGLTVAQIRDAVADSELPVDPGHTTVEEWLRDERVRGRFQSLSVDRIAYVARKVDAQVADRLDREADRMSTPELLAIRRVYVPFVEEHDPSTRIGGRLVEELFGPRP